MNDTFDDWRNYVPTSIREIWDELTDNERLLIQLVCEQIADREAAK